MNGTIKAALVCTVAGAMTFGGYCAGYIACRDKMQEDIDREHTTLVDARNDATEMQNAYGIVKALYDDMNIVTSNIANLMGRAEAFQLICESNPELQKHKEIYGKLNLAIANWQVALYMTEHPTIDVFATGEEKMEKIQKSKIGYATIGLSDVLEYSQYVYNISDSLVLNQSITAAKRLKAQECKTLSYNMVSKIKELITKQYSDEQAMLDAIPEMLKDVIKIDDAFVSLLMM